MAVSCAHVVVETANKCAARAPRAARLLFFFRPIRFFVCGVVVPIPFVDAKAPLLDDDGLLSLIHCQFLINYLFIFVSTSCRFTGKNA